MGAADDEAAAPLERMMRFATSYAEWSMANRGGYQLLFERADLRPMSALGPADLLGQHNGAITSISSAEQVRARVSGICAEIGIAPAEQDAHAMRLWCVIHGVVSLRIHKPNDHWQTTIEHDLRCILEHYSPRTRPPSLRSC